MKRIIATILLALFFSILNLSAVLAETEFIAELHEPADPDIIAPEDLDEARFQAWTAYMEAELSDDQLLEETEERAMNFGEATMRYTVQVIGEMPEDGYPLYIAMHGGGAGDPEDNDEQWEQMQEYYIDELECGVYVAVRGVRDTWDTHFNPESYPLYDRLIRYMILTQDVDPNRVYLEGFSAGGDGVYAIANRMADRFAAANMSSGHPNGISMLNLYNLPIQLQAGEFDDAYDRHRVTAEYGLLLDSLEEEYGGFIHRTLIHYDAGHNYNDWSSTPIPVMTDIRAWLENNDRSHTDVDSYPPHFMDPFTRDPLPQTVIWDLSTRASARETQAFYYLTAPYTTDSGVIFAAYDPETNEINVKTEGVSGEFGILLNEEMIDFTEPVSVTVNEAAYVFDPIPDRTVLAASTEDRGDLSYQFETYITFTPVS